jgi:hypothetical protein
MDRIRPAAVAGTFYPAEPACLRELVNDLLARGAPAHDAPIKALIVPHAGYLYSGAVAARAYARLRAQAGSVRRVVLLGPVHRVPVRGLALPDCTAFRTPLGDVAIDADAARRARELRQVRESAPAHAWEHSLEVQLPFLIAVLGTFALLPLAVGDATPGEVAEVLDAVWGGPETLIVISSDLSHDLPYAAAARVDGETIATMLALSPTLDHEQACGATPVNGLLLAAARRGLVAGLVDRCNSGDSAGDRERVVGYAALAFSAPARDRAGPGPTATDGLAGREP